MTAWETVAKQNGHLYCVKIDAWCCYTDWDAGGCTRSVCVREDSMDLYCKQKDRFCGYVDSETGECGASGSCPNGDCDNEWDTCKHQRPAPG